MPTTTDYLSQLQQDREDLVDNLETQGISDLTGNETFTELVPKVLDIETGGGSFQPRLPSGYQEVEYIQGTGTQYINTQYKPNQDTKTEISVETINLNTTFVPFGTRANAQLDYVIGINFNSQNYIQYNTNTAIYSTQSSTPLLNTKFTAILSKDEGKITYIDTSTETSTDIVMTPTMTNSFTCITDLYLGCLNNNGSTQYLSPSYKIYYCKIWENGILIKNLVPCYRKSDNEVGLYDLVNNSFLVNAGTGTFIKGNNHDTPLINLQNKTVTITKNTTTNITADSGYDGLSSVSVITNVSSEIPSEYTLVEYLETNGIGYIELSYKPSSKTTYQCEVQLIHEGKYDGCVFGVRTAGNSTDEFILWHNNGSLVTTENISPRRGTTNNNRYINLSYTNSDFPWRKITSIDNKAYFDDVHVGNYSTDNYVTSTYNLTIFALNTADSIGTNRMYRGRIKYLKIFDNLDLVFDFVPVIRNSDNKVGLYNRIDGIFYANELSTNFTAGPVV